MAISADGNLHIYVLNVGQADTSVIITPRGQVLIIDAFRVSKLVQLLRDLGLPVRGQIEHLLITHPHRDHHAGANRLVRTFQIKEATFAPFWHGNGTAPTTYCGLIAYLLNQNTPVRFLSGYSRYYPDGAMGTSGATINAQAPFLELLGPTNGLVHSLIRQHAFDTNHLSILARLTWRRFRMIFAADAQMENWGPFDNEELLKDRCQILKAPHHGSGNGTQWERLARLKPELVVVSSNPQEEDHLPDAVGSVVFTKYTRPQKHIAAITNDTGTIRITVQPNGRRLFHHFGEAIHEPVDLTNSQRLTWSSNPTKWLALSRRRVNAL